MEKVSIIGAAIVSGALAVHSSAQPMDTAKLLAMVDHLVYAGPDLRVATEKVEELLGVKATPGGQHPGRGTRNALISLGASSYIEIIGPDPEQPAPNLPRPFGIDGLREPKLVTWSAKEQDLSGRVKSAASKGVTLGAIAEGSRQRPDGLLLKWTYTDPRTVVADGLVPFFINWGATPHPAASAAGGGTLVGLKAEHPNAERIRAVLGQLGIALPVTAEKSMSLVATIDSPRGRVELR
jgi:Glyoxalase-like domain